MSKKFLVGIAVLAAVMFVVQYRMPRRFVWQATFSHQDRQPFGCYVMDTLLATSMSRGYSVTSKTLWQLSQDSTMRRNVLIQLSGRTELSVSHLLAMARRGDRFLIACNSYREALYDSLDVYLSWHYGFTMRDMAQKHDERVAVSWVGPAGGYAPHSDRFTLHPSLMEYTIVPSDSLPCEVLAIIRGDDDKTWRNLAVRCTVGHGEVILVTAPLLFTNYGILNREYEPLLSRFLNLVKDRPLVRLDPKSDDATYSNQESPFYVWLQRPPLQWTIYLTLVGVLLYLAFTARRRQRVVPVIEPPKNNNLEFVQLIGTLYYQQGSHHDLLRKKLAYATEEIRRTTGIDLRDDDAPERLAALAGNPVEEVLATLAKVR